MVLKKPIGKPKKFTAKGASKPNQGRKFQSKNKRREDKQRHVKKQQEANEDDSAFEDVDEIQEREVDGSDYD